MNWNHMTHLAICVACNAVVAAFVTDQAQLQEFSFLLLPAVN